MLLFAGLACTGCGTLGHSIGNYPVVTRLGPSVALPGDSIPLDTDLSAMIERDDVSPETWKFLCGPQGERTKEELNAQQMKSPLRVPLVRIAYVNRLSGDVITDSRDEATNRYMVVDIANAVLLPNFGISEDVPDRFATRKRIRGKIADIMLTAADWNGQTYWRNLLTFLQYYDAGKKTGTSLTAAGIAGAFISPVLGASLTGAGLAIDTGVDALMANIDIESFAKIRDLASTKREALRISIKNRAYHDDIDKFTLNDLVTEVNDYAFTYSIRGCIDAIADQKAQLDQLLKGQRTDWQELFETQAARLKSLRQGAAITDVTVGATDLSMFRNELNAAIIAHADDTSLRSQFETFRNDLVDKEIALSKALSSFAEATKTKNTHQSELQLAREALASAKFALAKADANVKAALEESVTEQENAVTSKLALLSGAEVKLITAGGAVRAAEVPVIEIIEQARLKLSQLKAATPATVE